VSPRRGASPSAAAEPLPAPFEWRRADGLWWLETPLGAGRTAFSTRLGGVSGGPFESLNLGVLTDDDPGSVERNRLLLAEAVGRDAGTVAMGLQVHGTGLRRHVAAPSVSAYLVRGVIEEADGQVTSHERVTPLVLVADCVPLALAVEGGVAAVHCGWRGVAGGIVERAVGALCEVAAARPEDVQAALGPGIGPCCYEVGDDVRAAFERLSQGSSAFTGRSFDLAAAIGLELEGAGLPVASITASGLCTSCRPDLFFSHRRDGGVTGRQAGMAWLDRR
jgi:polyphenol oxidase